MLKETTINSNRIFEGKLLKVDLLEISRDGSDKARREIVRHPGAVAAVARKSDGDFIFVQQYRKAVEKEMIEIVAGLLEEGETEAQCIVREVGEETGYSVEKAVRLGHVRSSPGYTEEKISIYYVQLGDKNSCFIPDIDEFIEIKTFSRQQVEQMLATNQIEDAKTYVAWWLYCRAFEDGRL